MIKKEFYKTTNFISLVVVLVVSIVLFIVKNKKNDELLSIGIYTVGEILNIQTMKGGLVYYYHFKIDGNFHNSEMRSGASGNIGDKYYVIYDPNNYDQNRMLLSLPLVTDSLYNIKHNWQKLPITVSNELLKKAIRL